MEGAQPGQLAHTDQRGMPYRMASCSAVTVQGKEQEAGMFRFTSAGLDPTALPAVRAC